MSDDESALRALTNKDIKNLARELKKAGFGLDVKRSKHLRITAPDDGSTYFTGITTSDNRVVKNVRKWAEHHGLDKR